MITIWPNYDIIGYKLNDFYQNKIESLEFKIYRFFISFKFWIF